MTLYDLYSTNIQDAFHTQPLTLVVKRRVYDDQTGRVQDHVLFSNSPGVQINKHPSLPVIAWGVQEDRVNHCQILTVIV